jgi:hypothetical protein
MKRLLWTIPMLFALISVNALADSVTYTITNANLYISPNYGGGGNMGFSMTGNGITLIGDGGTDPSFFDGSNGYLPGFARGRRDHSVSVGCQQRQDWVDDIQLRRHPAQLLLCWTGYARVHFPHQREKFHHRSAGRHLPCVRNNSASRSVVFADLHPGEIDDVVLFCPGRTLLPEPSHVC